MTDDPTCDDSRRPLGGRFVIFSLVAYALFLVIATYPMATVFTSQLPSLGDPLEHLWIMRWYKSCLLMGRSPFFCPGLHAPVGVPLGYFPPMHLEAALYLPLSVFIHNDALCYNMIWVFGFLVMGMGTSLLAWHVLRDRTCAWFAGLLAMLSTPMMMHGHGHLETMQAGGFPIFLLAWLRLWDRPGSGRLVAAVAAYLFLVMSAPYFLVLGLFPAGWYLLWRAVRAARARQLAGWAKPRLAWLAAFSALVLPFLLILFSSQLWAAAHGGNMFRPEAEFCHFGTRIWTYVFPTSFHALYRWLPYSPYVGSDRATCVFESGSYLGVVTLALMGVAASRRGRIERAGFWWSVFALLIVLSLGANATLGTHRVSLPSGWLYRVFAPYRLIRVPARFNIFAAVIAALLAAAGLHGLRARIGKLWIRASFTGLLALLALADLAMVPYTRPSAIPAVPPLYAAILHRNPEANLLEIPQFRSDGSLLNCVGGYWQALHGGRTSAGYSGLPNAAFDNLIYRTSPFDGDRLADPAYLQDPGAVRIDLLRGVDFDGYAWLYLTYHDYPYILLHHSALIGDKRPLDFARLRATFKRARIHEDDAITVYDRSLLARPSRLVFLLADGWLERSVREGRPACPVGRTARVVVYQPKSDGDIAFTLTAKAFRAPRLVRLLWGSTELGRWRVDPDRAETLASPPFRLPAGIHQLTLASDGQERPIHNRELVSDGDKTPYSLTVTEITLESRSSPSAGHGLARRP